LSRHEARGRGLVYLMRYQGFGATQADKVAPALASTFL